MIRTLLALILLASSPSQADLKGTGNFYAWDEVALKYQNSNVIISTDGELLPVIYVLNFDSDLADNRASCSVEHFAAYDPVGTGCNPH